ncbi:MAG: pyridoxamine 5'-phosphate oxidase family protein, partial [Pseudomonadota bacterium]
MALEDIANLEDVEAWVIGSWERASRDRRHAFRWPAIATVNAAGGPSVRTVVLRQFVAARRRFTFFTEARSSKAGEIARDASVALHFFDPRRRVQVRVDGCARLLTDGAAWQQRFDQLTEVGRRDYTTTTAPGEPVDTPEVHRTPDLAQNQFTVIEVEAR